LVQRDGELHVLQKVAQFPARLQRLPGLHHGTVGLR
jgi:hypothetical protein